MTRNLDMFLTVPDVQLDERDPLDRHYTPRWMTEALLAELGPGFLNPRVNPRILEPCAGEGHIGQVLAEHGLDVTCRDIAPPPRPLMSVAQDDFLNPRDPDERWDWVITNSAYLTEDGSRVSDFVRRALEVADVGVAFLTWLNFLEGTADRIDLLRSHTLRRMIVLPRGSFITPGRRNKGPSLPPVWLVWYPRANYSKHCPHEVHMRWPGKEVKR